MPNKEWRASWGHKKYSAKSGYSSAVKVRFETPAPGSYWYWCGHDYYPLQSSQVRAGR